ncbi:AMP-dependent synthetase/ligase [Pseudonocardia sp. GCM10023141]|uniref:AMP-dependent synthetase/ligase n=1 Tax=Pseudonocardia sp. GCM10023141 TaxID=3252653 RepID=UPI00361FC4E2
MTVQDVDRQVEVPTTVSEMSRFGAQRFGDSPAQRFKRDGEWQDVSYAQLHECATEIARGLIALGVAAGDRVAVLADTRAEWTQAELGIAAAGAVVVPIYPSSTADECAWVLGDSGSVAVFVEDATQLAKIDQVRGELPALQHAVTFTDGDVTTLEALRASGRDGDIAEVTRRTDAVHPDDPGLIIYTSGTTGRPKGCVLAHRNLTACCAVCNELDVVNSNDVVYLFLPMAHVFAQVTVLGSAGAGAVVAYCSNGAKGIMTDLQEVSPTYLPSVPRIFEKIFAGVAGMVPADLRTRAVAAGMAVQKLREAGQPIPAELQAGFDLADSQLFAKVRAVFGGKLRQAVSGAAPIATEILEFFYAAGVPVYEGYGLSESAAMGTLNSAGHMRIGSIGRAIPGCEVRIAEDGEILMRGGHIFTGYWNNEAATAETIVDGWLQSGDLGTIDDDGFVTIIGRKKDIIITAGGKNLTPNNLENDLRQSPWISQAVMHGDRRPYPVALITLDAELIVPWAQQQGLPGDVAELATHPTVVAMVQEVLDGVNERYAKVSQIKKFLILDHDLSVETGELTPTLKVKRRVVDDRYKELFDGLYGG